MTTPFDHGPEFDDRPAAVATARMPYRPRPSRIARVFRWWLGLSVVVVFACALCLYLGLHNMDFAPMHVVVVGDDLSDGITINGLNDGARSLLAVGGLLLALSLLLLVPVLILLIVGSVAIALVCGLGVPLIVLALLFGVFTSPFWIVALLVWLVARRRSSPTYARSATMAA